MGLHRAIGVSKAYGSYMTSGLAGCPLKASTPSAPKANVLYRVEKLVESAATEYPLTQTNDVTTTAKYKSFMMFTRLGIGLLGWCSTG